MKIKPEPPETQRLHITGLGALGDGIAGEGPDQRYVAFALPGETVRPSGGGLPEVLSEPSPDRRAPLCRHFGVCGGCVAQHMSERLYGTWKHEMVATSFRQRGLQQRVEPLRHIPPGSRRRAIFTARRGKLGVRLGYHAGRSHDLVDVEECPVLLPEIVAQLPALRAIVGALPGREARLTVLASPAGLDVAIDCKLKQLGPRGAADLAGLAERHRIARITAGDEVIVERGKPSITIGGAAVAVPAGSFVQAAGEAEAEMTRLVLAATAHADRVADLFCGIGTFSLPLAAAARVLAVDSDRAAISALETAARSRQGLKPIETRVRDLFREPLSAKELAGFGAVVFDPPRAGARNQAQQIAQSAADTVVAVSCDAGTLARDVRILVDGGYRIESVTPIDQFVFSAHVETVAVLRRPSRRKIR